MSFPHDDITPSAATGEGFRASVERALLDPSVLTTVYQPVVDLARGAVCGFEAITRFQSGSSPSSWFAAAWRVGLGGALEARVVRRALASLELLPASCFLSVSVTTAALLAPEVTEALGEVDRLDGLVLELADESPLHVADHVLEALGDLRERGATVSVNAAGAGYSSLRWILTVRPQFVKLDRELVLGVDGDEAKAAAIEHLAGFSSRIDAWVNAPGIERLEELDAIIRLGVPLGQGQALGEPVRMMDEREFALGPYVRSRAADRANRGAGLASLLERPPFAGEQDGDGELTALFDGDPNVSAIPVLDAQRRPIALAERDAHARGEPARVAPMIVQPDAELVEVVRRAMTRPLAERFLPVLCCDPRGRYVGIVRVERLVEALAGR